MKYCDCGSWGLGRIMNHYKVPPKALTHPTLLESAYMEPLQEGNRKSEVNLKEFFNKTERTVSESLNIPEHITKGENSMNKLDHSLNNQHGQAWIFLTSGQKEYLQTARNKGFTIQTFCGTDWVDIHKGTLLSPSRVYRVKPEEIKKDSLNHNLNNFRGEPWTDLSNSQRAYLTRAEECGYSIQYWNRTESHWMDGCLHPAFDNSCYRIKLSEIEKKDGIRATGNYRYNELSAAEKAFLHQNYEENKLIECRHDGPGCEYGWMVLEQLKWHSNNYYKVSENLIYCFINDHGQTVARRDEGFPADKKRKAIGNYYSTRAQAEEHVPLVRKAYQDVVGVSVNYFRKGPKI